MGGGEEKSDAIFNFRDFAGDGDVARYSSRSAPSSVLSLPRGARVALLRIWEGGGVEGGGVILPTCNAPRVESIRSRKLACEPLCRNGDECMPFGSRSELIDRCRFNGEVRGRED